MADVSRFTNAVVANVAAEGLRISLDVSAFPKHTVFAYIDSDYKVALAAGNTAFVVTDLNGVDMDGVIELPERAPFGWLEGKRHCLKLVPHRNAKQMSFLCDADGEFGVELYCLRASLEPTLIFQRVFALM